LTLFLDKMRGTPDDLYGRKVLHLVAQMAYPAVVGFIAEKCGVEDAAFHLRDIGNTLIVVEHDRDMMKEADEIIDKV